jgi:D-arginine dehydrogenase
LDDRSIGSIQPLSQWIDELDDWNMPERKQFEVIIIGGGIAGASLAYFLAERGMTEVVLLEREAQPGYHTTGRSAASLVEWDPIPALQELKLQSAPFLRHPPSGFAEQPVLHPSGILATFQEPVWSAAQQVAPLLAERGVQIELLSPSAVVERVPVLSPAHVDGGILLPEDGHLDVHELLWSYLRQARRRGVETRWGVEVTAIRTEGRQCRSVVTSAGELATRWVVNAAGAWAGTVASMASATPIPITPRRRTIITFAAPDGLDVGRWPLVDDEAHRLYFKPESGGLLASPMDEEPLPPCDARPDDLVIAETIERLRYLAPRLVPKALRRTWAGLRTFTPDRVLAVGADPLVRGFFWLAGQGGCGIETSPAVGRIATDLLLDGRTDRFDAALLDPARFAMS